MRIFFMGTPEFALASLQALCSAGHEICGVFTRPDAPKGRGMALSVSPVKSFALENNIEVFQPVKLRDGAALELIRQRSPDIIVVVAYGRLLPLPLLTAAELGCVNVHASLLPKLRGAAPIQWAIINGEAETGVTTQHMAEEMDAGDIIMQAKTPIGERETAGLLHDRLAQLGAAILPKTIELLARGGAARIPQDHGAATFAPILKKGDGEIDPGKTTRELDCFIRGMSPWPGARLGGLAIHRAEAAEESFDLPIGSIAPGGLLICRDGALRLLEVQAPGARRMTYEEYERGLRK